MTAVPSLVIHGGAGAYRGLTPAQEEAITDALRAVLQQGCRLLKKGTSALTVVETCVALLEDDPLFNAGRGAAPTAGGRIELDAAIMDGRTLKAGAVAAVPRVKNPVALARLVMEKTPHVMLAGQGALAFARAQGVTLKDKNYFLSLPKVAPPRDKHGTVGAVARDVRGHLAAATSTGGTAGQRDGRVGDSPIIGAGVWADDATCAVSCTGRGEDFIRTALAKHTADLVTFRRLGAQRAAYEAMAYLQEKVKGDGGLIVVDAAGCVGRARCSRGMATAWVDAEGTFQVSVF